MIFLMKKSFQVITKAKMIKESCKLFLIYFIICQIIKFSLLHIFKHLSFNSTLYILITFLCYALITDGSWIKKVDFSFDFFAHSGNHNTSCH